MFDKKKKKKTLRSSPSASTFIVIKLIIYFIITRKRRLLAINRFFQMLIAMLIFEMGLSIWCRVQSGPKFTLCIFWGHFRSMLQFFQILSNSLVSVWPPGSRQGASFASVAWRTPVLWFITFSIHFFSPSHMFHVSERWSKKHDNSKSREFF